VTGPGQGPNARLRALVIVTLTFSVAFLAVSAVVGPAVSDRIQVSDVLVATLLAAILAALGLVEWQGPFSGRKP
jgi:multisubunit Na+/H+ antiporter MnhF subunit